MVKLLNIGCGTRFHPDWVNIDLAPSSPAVKACNIAHGLPYRSNEFDAVYHSHVLEHLECEKAPSFLRDCHRVLKSGGIVRVVVPDLERIAREYLKCLELAMQGDAAAETNYDWIMLELYDQVVRRKPGGGMLDFLKSRKDINIAYIRTRCGEEIASLALPSSVAGNIQASHKPSLAYRSMRTAATRARRFIESLVVGADRNHLEQARFLASGELHRWMYDKLSLPRLLRACGFDDVHQMAANESRIAMWDAYCLDADTAGHPHKPDSLYVEAVKP